MNMASTHNLDACHVPPQANRCFHSLCITPDDTATTSTPQTNKREGGMKIRKIRTPREAFPAF